jgi:glycolate oxidase FAD binding subunit
MKAASRARASVVPRGSGTKTGIGNKPLGADIVLSTRKLNRVIAHESSDLVATTECGITLTELQSHLGRKNQFLPVDPPHVQGGATVGGIIAANDSGPLRLRYGTSRELLIGMKVVRADGSIFKGGSKVVKNVAGYDMPKLFVGSLGTLGIIAEATFRLYPVPESSGTYFACFESLDEAHGAVRSLIDSALVINARAHESRTRRKHSGKARSRFGLQTILARRKDNERVAGRGGPVENCYGRLAEERRKRSDNRG